MSIITQQLTWPSWKFGVLKFSMIAFGILLGAYFPEFFRPWHVVLWAVFGVTAAATTVWGLQTLRETKTAKL